MCSDTRQWQRIRHRILVEGASQKQVSRQTGISTNTIRKMLSNPEPVPYGPRERVFPKLRPYKAAIRQLLEERKGSPPNVRQWTREIYDEIPRQGYPTRRKLYLSWDDATWHRSKRLYAWIDRHNASALAGGLPALGTVPLPSSAQFLNVIESVFSVMARAVIHNSNYASVEEAKAAIDRHFADRNSEFRAHPKRAGETIWGSEREPAVFSEANNCKDPAYR